MTEQELDIAEISRRKEAARQDEDDKAMVRIRLLLSALAVAFLIFISIVAWKASAETIYDHSGTATCTINQPQELYLFSVPTDGVYHVTSITQRMTRAPLEENDILMFVSNDAFVSDIHEFTIPWEDIEGFPASSDVTVDVSDAGIFFYPDSGETGNGVLYQPTAISAFGTRFFRAEATTGHEEAFCLGSPTYTGEGYGDAMIEADLMSVRKEWIMPFINTAHATQTCEFIVTGATTTAECSDALVRDEPRDSAIGIFIALALMALVLFYFKKERR